MEDSTMIQTSLLQALRELDRADKLRVIQVLVIELAEEEGAYDQTAEARNDQGAASFPITSLTLRELQEGYQAMAADEAREAEASEWAEATIGDVAHEAR
jgi:hypothetical protein